MLQLEVLIRESVTIDAATSSSILVGEISSLNHKVFDDSVEDGAFIAFPNWFFGQFNKVFHSFRNCFAKQTNLNAPNSFTTNFNIKPYLN
jgi:hypothetical protein